MQIAYQEVVAFEETLQAIVVTVGNKLKPE